MKHFLYISFLFLFSAACGPRKPAVQTIPIDRLYSVELPDNLRPGYDMHDYAGLQYYDAATDFYVIGLDDSKNNFGKIQRQRLKIKNYFEFAERTAFEHVDSTYQTSTQEFVTSQGLKAKAADYFVQDPKMAENLPIFYRVCVFENEDHFFQLMIWMPYDVHCERYDWIEMITHSFKVIEDQEEET